MGMENHRPLVDSSNVVASMLPSGAIAQSCIPQSSFSLMSLRSSDLALGFPRLTAVPARHSIPK